MENIQHLAQIQNKDMMKNLSGSKTESRTNTTFNGSQIYGFFHQEPNLRSNYIWCSMNLKGISERMLEKIFCKTMVSLKWLKRSAMEARFILSDTIYGTYLRLTKCLCSRPSNGLFSHFCLELFSLFEQGRVQKLVSPTK